MGKISKLKKDNIKQSKSKLQKKIQQKKKAKYGKNKVPVELREPVTYYDRKKIKEFEKEQKKKLKGQKNKPEETKEVAKRTEKHFADRDDMWDPSQVDEMISKEDDDFIQRMKEDAKKEDDLLNNRVRVQEKAKNLLQTIDDVDMDEEAKVVVAFKEEKDYEMRVIKQRERQEALALEAAQLAPRSLLPIVGSDGKVTSQYKDSENEKPEEKVEEAVVKETPSVVSTVDIMLERKRKLNEKKLFIGCAATKIISDPDNNMVKLKELIVLVFEKDVEIALTVRKMAALSLLRIFDSILPNYKLATMDKPGVTLKKENREIVTKEKQLLCRYVYYLKGLEAMIVSAERNHYTPLYVQMAKVAFQCISHLLLRNPTFNKSDLIIRFLVPHLSNPVDELRADVVKTFETIFKEDENGLFSLRAVKVIREFVRKKSFQVHSDCMRVLIHLRITQASSLDTLNTRKTESENQTKQTAKLLKKVASRNAVKMSITQKKRRHKKAQLEHKLKEQKLNEKKSRETTTQTEIIEILFALYVHVIKNLPNRKVLGAVLEGLSQFGHLMSIDYFTDLLANLESILLRQNLSTIEAIHCIQTVFRLLTGLGSTLPNDPSCFADKLYSLLLNIADIEVTEDTVKAALETLLIFFIQCKKRVGVKQSIGFVKRLSHLATSVNHSYAIPIMMTMRSIMLNHPSCQSLLDLSGEGSSGIYQPLLNHPVHCNAEVSSLIEMHSLAKSYHPMVRQLAVHLYRGAPLLGEGALPASFTKHNVEKLMNDYSMKKVEFCPALMDPKQHLRGTGVWSGTEKRRISTVQISIPALVEYTEEEEREVAMLTKLQKSSDDISVIEEDELEDLDFFSREEEEDLLISLEEEEEEEEEEIVDYSSHLLMPEESEIADE